ncbi:tryptophan halogenase [Novosphingobium sediminis]|uniref:Tryptophan halogenase n=1 Tax=Novosphingobium sediminis TaxID=707214 RepID=A0A512AFA0_9SPHN|nr:tryptophan halogenase family protein [Novosphingobium sediminis]GEN98384.1 tryptophan halogenase [Novosphingobium sediminis]
MAAARRFVILGGGTAGWMAAALIAHRCRELAVSVTLVESPEIGIIGVGEGSTPQLKVFFDELGIAEREWMPACHATYKTGIRFAGWSDAPGFESYFHPFQSALDGHTAPAFYFHTRARRTGRDVVAHPDRFFLAARLAEARLGPVPGENFPFDLGYGYHFDATLVGQFLAAHATEKLGVHHVPRRVSGTRRDAAGGIAALVLEGGEEIAGDFFIDASGFRASLIGEALGEPFESFAGNLFNNAAVALPGARDAGATSCETVSTALSSGWAWRIPLTDRTGNGYVYSTDFLSPDVAETELRRHLGLLDADIPARHLSMRVGQVRRSWVGNCLAIGLAQGFIEPLEATALHIVHATLSGWLEALLADGFGPSHRDQFNAAIHARYEGIRDYIVCHYRMNRRDGEYWRANAANDHLSDNLKSLMTCWFRGGELDEEVARLGIDRYYAPLSWHCLFAGYGQFPDAARLRPPEADLPLADMAKIDRFIAGCALNFPAHDDLLARLEEA